MTEQHRQWDSARGRWVNPGDIFIEDIQTAVWDWTDGDGNVDWAAVANQLGLPPPT